MSSAEQSLLYAEVLTGEVRSISQYVKCHGSHVGTWAVTDEVMIILGVHTCEGFTQEEGERK